MWDALCLKGGTLVYVGDPKADLGGPLAGKGAPLADTGGCLTDTESSPGDTGPSVSHFGLPGRYMRPYR